MYYYQDAALLSLPEKVIKGLAIIGIGNGSTGSSLVA